MYPRLLIVGRVAWTKGQSTLSSIFEGYPADQLAYICIETKEPDYSRCVNHFQISEIALLKKLYRWNTKTGRRRLAQESTKELLSLEKSEGKTGGWVRRHRSNLFLLLREVLWSFGGWKTKELKQFISDFAPDAIFFLGDPLPLMARLEQYILQIAPKPAAIFMMDDIWSYKSNFSLHRYLLRREVVRLISSCKAHFSISELMKKEYDEIFQIHSIILTKGIEAKFIRPDFDRLHNPIKIVYAGKLIYGRDHSMVKILDAIRLLNNDNIKVELHVYTPTELSFQIKQSIDCVPGVFFHKPVPYHEVAGILDDSDIVLFLESLEKKQRYVARLSFSTKMTDYLASGKCIFAVGDSEIAPIVYLKENNAAMICSSYNDIEMQIQSLVLNPQLISHYAQRSFLLGQDKHRSDIMQSRLINTINDIINEEKNMCNNNH